MSSSRRNGTTRPNSAQHHSRALHDGVPEAVDVVVIGAGIVGAAAAYQLAKRGLSVAIIDKGGVGGEQSSRNWGFVRQQGRDPLELPLASAASVMWGGLEAELDADIEWRRGGNLALAPDEATAGEYEDWLGVSKEAGIETELVSRSRVQSLVPGMQGDWKAAMYTASDGQADPMKATVAFVNAAKRYDARVLTHCTVESVEVDGDRVTGVRTSAGHIRTSRVVVAAGIWSHRLLKDIGLRLPQRVVRQTVVRTAPVPQFSSVGVWAADVLSFRQATNGSLILSLGGVSDVCVGLGSLHHALKFTPVYLRNRSKFRITVGGLTTGAAKDFRASRSFQLASTEPIDRDVAMCLDRLQMWFPALARPDVEDAWSGYIDGTPDTLPVIESSTEFEGLVIATGFSGHGFALGPIVGQIVGELLGDGHTQFDIDHMRLARFSTAMAGKAKKMI